MSRLVLSQGTRGIDLLHLLKFEIISSVRYKNREENFYSQHGETSTKSMKGMQAIDNCQIAKWHIEVILKLTSAVLRNHVGSHLRTKPVPADSKF